MRVARGLGSVRGRIAVITGAASGIGLATARLLAERGAELALCDLDAEKLEAVAGELRQQGGRVISRVADVADPRALAAFAHAVTSELGVPHLLVNNAGVVVYGSFLATPLEDWDHVIDVNLKGPVNVCRALLPAMLEGGQGGHVVNVASAAAFFTQSELAAYGTTKHGLVGLTQALADELRTHGIGVSLVCPGFVDTPILERARIRGFADPEAERRAAVELLRRRRLSAERVAASIVRAAERGVGVVTVGIEAHALRLISRLAPARTAALFGVLRRLGSRT
jgi:NAD(P)-dependent dehydrogenase (short-subunit alcohol dehydrogenase family)